MCCVHQALEAGGKSSGWVGLGRGAVPLAILSSSRKGPDWVTGAGDWGEKTDAWMGRKSLALKIQRA